MKQVLILFFAIFFFASCNQLTGSGNIVTENRSTGSFNAISVGGSFDVEVKNGSTTSVVVEADDNIIKYIETSVSGNTLKILTEGMHNYMNVHMKVIVTAPSITAITASASADVVADGVLTGNEKISFYASSSASIQADVNAPEIESGASSSGTVTLTGKTKSHSSKASSSGTVKAFGLLSETTKASTSSSGTVEIFASVNLDAQASSSGSVDYKGNAAVTKQESSSGSVEKKD